MPEAPDAGLWSSVKYTLGLLRGLVQRRKAVRQLSEQIRADTTVLDALLGELGRTTRKLAIDNDTLSAENQAIDEAEARRAQAQRELDEMGDRAGEENLRMSAQVEERESKVTEAKEALAAAEDQLQALEAQKRSLRDKRKTVERQQAAYLKKASDDDDEASKHPIGAERDQLRRASEDLRQQAAALDPERQDLERKLAGLEKPISQGMAEVERLKAELESVKDALKNAREGHRQRQSELEAEQGHKQREVNEADSEVARRMVNLGTLVNLRRISLPELTGIYVRIDEVKNAITRRSDQIDKLNTERDTWDRKALTRGALTLGITALIVLTVVVVIIAVT